MSFDNVQFMFFRFRGMVCGFMNRSWKKNCVKCRSPKPTHDQNAANDGMALNLHYNIQ